MQVTQTSSEGLKREFKVVIAAKDIDAKVEDRLREVGSSVRIPGFRPGKVPLQVLRQRYGKAVLGEVLESAVNDGSSQAMAEHGLRPAMQPKIEITNFDEGQDLEFKMAVELMPDIEPMDFSEIELERIKVAAPDAEVDEALKRLAGRQKKTKPLEAERPAQKSDVLVIDFRGSVDGEELPGMAGEDHHLDLGSNQFVEGFEDQLIGARKGEEREVKVTFPETYMNDKLAGREAVFHVTIKDILESEPQAIDDELAKQFGEDSLDAMRERIRGQIEQEYSQLTRARLKRQLLDRLADGHDFAVPGGMVDAEFEAIWQQVQEDKERGQLDPEDQGKSDEELQAEYRQIAERRVRLGLLLSEVGRVNNIEVSQEELHRALLQEAQRHPGHEREVIDYFQKNPQAMANLRAPLFEDKVVDFIVEMAKVKERALSPEALREEMMRAEAAQSEEGEGKAKPVAKAGAKKGGAKKSAAKGKGKAKSAPAAEKES